jgi:hypothetical protein
MLSVGQKFKGQPQLSDHDDALSDHALLINRAIAMHLLREGKFNVAATFVEEANAHPPRTSRETSLAPRQTWEFKSETLQKQFGDMYHILHELRQESNLTPAIQWARKHRNVLESRASNLEFELCRLEFVRLFLDEIPSGDLPRRAWEYANREFQPFQRRYEKEVAELASSLAFYQNIETCPYRHLFLNNNSWEDVANTFTKEFCSMLGLSADSPLYVAATAGAIALPVLNKVKSIMIANRTEWTTAQEMPVGFRPSPYFYSQAHSVHRPKYRFHHLINSTPSLCVLSAKSKPLMIIHQ